MDKYGKISRRFIAPVILTLLILSACAKGTQEDFLPINKPTMQRTAALTKSSSSQEWTNTPTKTPQAFFATSTELPHIELSCEKPSDDYKRIEINGYELNQRTFEMLQLAQILYDGIITITGDAITQGSYTSAVEASFGTHVGGGVVDLSVMAPGTYTILYEDIDPLIKALRSAGFAAWYRDLDELYDGSPAHIHAVAIGDRELSLAAREQLSGPFGYFWGYNGLPTTDKKPGRDPHSGPVLCDWMLEKGYPNKTATPPPGETAP
ncbi:MAG: hypothetical protein RQ728_10890 [Brevefilum sp.]|nr:hypothetical protein [Brevefilum sp.]